MSTVCEGTHSLAHFPAAGVRNLKNEFTLKGETYVIVVLIALLGLFRLSNSSHVYWPFVVALCVCVCVCSFNFLFVTSTHFPLELVTNLYKLFF